MSEEGALQTFFKGHFLIAMPSLEDPNFSETVTYICEHSDEGAVGLIINRIHPELTMEAIFKELDMTSIPRMETAPVHLGGPVYSDQIFVLHGPPFGWEACRLVTPTLALSNSQDVLEQLAKGEGPESFLITLGCAGWGAGQLESEIMENSWLSCPASETILFETPPERQWAEAAKLMGVDVRHLAGIAGHA